MFGIFPVAHGADGALAAFDAAGAPCVGELLIVQTIRCVARIVRVAGVRDDMAWPMANQIAVAVPVVEVRRDRALGRIHKKHRGAYCAAIFEDSPLVERAIVVVFESAMLSQGVVPFGLKSPFAT